MDSAHTYAYKDQHGDYVTVKTILSIQRIYGKLISWKGSWGSLFDMKEAVRITQVVESDHPKKCLYTEMQCHAG